MTVRIFHLLGYLRFSLRVSFPISSLPLGNDHHISLFCHDFLRDSTANVCSYTEYRISCIVLIGYYTISLPENCPAVLLNVYFWLCTVLWNKPDSNCFDDCWVVGACRKASRTSRFPQRPRELGGCNQGFFFFILLLYQPQVISVLSVWILV